ncbi:hypothetical protein Tco_1403441 [Tanacetum coccineum]
MILIILEEAKNFVDRVSSASFSNGVKIKEGGSILEILEEMITVGQTMGFSMEGCTKDMEKIIGTQGEQLIIELESSELNEEIRTAVGVVEFDKSPWPDVLLLNYFVNRKNAGSNGLRCMLLRKFGRVGVSSFSSQIGSLFQCFTSMKGHVLDIRYYNLRRIEKSASFYSPWSSGKDITPKYKKTKKKTQNQARKGKAVKFKSQSNPKTRKVKVKQSQLHKLHSKTNQRN